MVALEVKLNGKRVCIAGADDLTVLSAHVTACGKLGRKSAPRKLKGDTEIFYSVGGLSPRPKGKDIYPKWKSVAPLRIDDVLEVKIVETQKVDRATSRKAKKRRLRR